MNFERKLTTTIKIGRTPIAGFPGSATVPVATAGVSPAESARPAFPPFGERAPHALTGPYEKILLRCLRCLLFKTVLSLCILHLALSASAQVPSQTGNRFLFIINTSSAMRRMTNGIQEAVLGLLNSGMQGQMRDGDTFGIWTYDDQLHTGFPMQVWSNKNQGVILQTVSNCLAAPRYQAKPHLEMVLPAALRLVEQSRAVTLVFIFDGSEAMQGTGFDQEINGLHGEFGSQMRAGDIPFVTALAARDGKVFDYRVRTPSSVSLPPTADFFKPAETNTVPTVAAATNLPPADVVVPHPPEPPRREIVLKPEPLPATNPPPVPASVPVEPVAPEKPESVLPPAPPPVLQPGTRSGARQSAAIVPPAPTPPTQPAPTQAQPAVVPVQAPSTIVPPANAPTNSQSAIEGKKTSEQEKTEITEMRNQVSPVPPSPPVVQSPIRNPQLAAPTRLAKASGDGGSADEGGSAIPNPQSEIRNPQSSNGSTESRPTVQDNPQSPIPNPQSVAVALPAPANHRALLAVAICLVAIGVVLSLLLIRRSRAAPSLISQSMDRPR